MVVRRAFLSGAAVSALAVLAGCGKMFPETLRVRLVVEVETPQGLRTGSSVMELSAWRNKFAFNGATRGRSLNGEAVVVDLPGERNLFALLKAEGRELFDTVLGAIDPTYNNDWVETIERIKNRPPPKRVHAVLPVYLGGRASSGVEGAEPNYPMLVSFKSINDPTSIERVDAENLAGTFGPGFKLRRITVQVTKEPVSTGIEHEIGWLSQAVNGQLPKKSPTSKGPPFGLQAADFSTEIGG